VMRRLAAIRPLPVVRRLLIPSVKSARSAVIIPLIDYEHEHEHEQDG
jgi:hypothetical protein